MDHQENQRIEVTTNSRPVRKFKKFQPSLYVSQRESISSFHNDESISTAEIENLAYLVKNKLKLTRSTGEITKKSFILPKLLRPNLSDTCLPRDSNDNFIIPLLNRLRSSTDVSHGVEYINSEKVDLPKSVEHVSSKETEVPKHQQEQQKQQEKERTLIDLTPAIQIKASTTKSAGNSKLATMKPTEKKAKVIQDEASNSKDAVITSHSKQAQFKATQKKSIVVHDKPSTSKAATITSNSKQARAKAKVDKINLNQNIKIIHREYYAGNQESYLCGPSVLAQLLFNTNEKPPLENKIQSEEKPIEITTTVTRFQFDTKSPDEYIPKKSKKSKKSRKSRKSKKLRK